MIKTVSSKISLRIIDMLLMRGMNWETITRKTGIYVFEVASGETRIDARRHYKLLNALNESNRENTDWLINSCDFRRDFFLFNRETVLFEMADDFYALAMLCLNSPTLGSAINNYLKYRCLVGNIDDIVLEMCGDKGYIIFHHELKNSDFYSVIMVNFFHILAVVSHYVKGDVSFTIHATIKKNCNVEAIYRHWGSKGIQWGSQENALVLDATLFDIALESFNPQCYQLTRKKVENEVAQSIRHSSFAWQVEQAIASLYRNHIDSRTIMSTICSTYSLTRTTLHRRLTADGTNFREIHNQVKLSYALELLAQPELSINDISCMLGFASQSAFYNFFFKHMHITPSEYRKSGKMVNIYPGRTMVSA
ncbi:helix-turn-helix domain-containing protein [Klebsiella variicola]